MSRRVARPRTFIVECLASPVGDPGATRGRDGLQAACARQQAGGTAIEYLGAVLVPEDELVLHVFVSSGPDIVRDACERADVGVERIVEAVAIGSPPNHAVLVPDLRGRGHDALSGGVRRAGSHR
jgi:hypothetical protein